MVSYKGKEKTIPDYKIISALTKFALKGKPVKIKFDNEVYEIPPDVFIHRNFTGGVKLKEFLVPGRFKYLTCRIKKRWLI